MARTTRGLVLLALLSIVAPARADEVTLTTGGKVTGKVLEETDDHVRVRTEKGLIITLRREEVDSISREKPEDAFARRAKGVHDDDAKALLELARAAKDLGLADKEAACLEKVLKLDPQNVDARIGLGYEKVQGKWYRGDELKRAQGLVEYQGRWVRPEDKQCLEQGLVKKGDRWLTREEAEAEERAESEPAPSTGLEAGEGGTPSVVKERPTPEKPAPRKPEAKPPVELPAADKELLRLLAKPTPDDRRLEALRALAAKGDDAKEGARQELARQVDLSKKEVLEFAKREKAQVRARMAALIAERRQTALAFIMDPKKYPEEDHGAVAQPEVDKLVGALRRAWQDPLRELKAQNEKKVASGLDEIKKLQGWAKDVLGDGTSYEKLEDDLAFDMDRIIQSSKVPVDDKDAQILEKSQQIMKYNETVPSSLSVEERQCLLATNEYRLMFGLVALKTFEPLVQAARKHAKEMIELKYFSHDSPRPENASAGARCTREGGHCTGENIAMGSTSGRATFYQWYTSSGHHRNILTKSHRSVGIGAFENHWTQDFGSDDP
jgi:uncharacterized protein YkwD